MKKCLSALFSLLVMSAILISCQPGSGEGLDERGNPIVQEAEPEPGTQSSPPNAIRSTGLGDVFTNEAGWPLYFFDGDEPNVSNCDASCRAIWPPVLASGTAQASGDFGIIELSDGTRQWTWRARPVYLYEGDSGVSDPGCDQPQGDWHVVRPDELSTPNRIRNTGLGDIYVNGTKLPLYFFDNDEANVSNCDEDCLTIWPRVNASATAIPAGDFGIIDLDDGSRQWTFRSRPLYLFGGDSATEDPFCDQPNGLWHALRVNNPPEDPSDTSGAGLQPTLESIQANIFTPICAECHKTSSPPQGLILDSIENSSELLIDHPANEVPDLKRVDPGDPENSYIIQKLEGTAAVGARMPLGQTPLSDEDIAVIKEWIRSLGEE